MHVLFRRLQLNFSGVLVAYDQYGDFYQRVCGCVLLRDRQQQKRGPKNRGEKIYI